MAKTFDILLIEDDSVENQLISSILNDGFVNLIKYSLHSEPGRNKFPNHHFDVVIIDIDTLNEDRPFYGMILHQLRNQNPHCMMMVLTSETSEKVIKPLMQNKVRELISKPFDACEILSPIRKQLGGRFKEFQQQVDNEHRTIDEKVVEIKELILIKSKEKSAQHIFSQKLKQLSNLISDHFLLEERHMSLYRYPDLDLHQNEHHSLLEDIKMLLDFSGNHEDAEDDHLEIIKNVETKLDHDQHFMDFVSHLSYLNNEYVVSY